MLGLAVLPLLHSFYREGSIGMMSRFLILGLTNATAGAQSPASATAFMSSTLPK
jgi:hypothetical protein